MGLSVIKKRIVCHIRDIEQLFSVFMVKMTGHKWDMHLDKIEHRKGNVT